MVEEPVRSSGDSEHADSAAALSSAWQSLSEAKMKRRRVRMLAAEFMERAPDPFGEDVERSMRPRP